MSEQPSLCTKVWQLQGLFGTRPGMLALGEGRLAFVTEEGCLFEAPLAEVSGVKFPWYYFGGGMKLTVGGARYRLSFVRPNGAQDIPDQLLVHLGIPAGLGIVRRKFADIGDGRKAGKAWRSVLTANARG